MLILASKSPRRQELLRNAGIPFVVRTPDVEEVRYPQENPSEYVARLARLKSESIAARAEDIVLGADTIVVLDGVVLEKPADAADASRMLDVLGGRTHEVLTGICLRKGGDCIEDIACTRVTFRPLTGEEIGDYVATGEPFDKAGAYGIQGMASRFVEKVDGCYFNVVGLPVSLVYRHWRSLSGSTRRSIADPAVGPRNARA